MSVSENAQHAVVNLDRCLGCGVCVDGCPADSISLLKKPTETRPPETIEELYDIIKNNKKHKLGKLKLRGKIIVDAIRTGQSDLLKS